MSPSGLGSDVPSRDGAAVMSSGTVIAAAFSYGRAWVSRGGPLRDNRPVIALRACPFAILLPSVDRLQVEPDNYS